MRQVPGALGRPRGIGWRERWEGASRWRIHVNPWLIHVNVWQNPLQCCEVISLQLIKINEKKKKELIVACLLVVQNTFQIWNTLMEKCDWWRRSPLKMLEQWSVTLDSCSYYMRPWVLLTFWTWIKAGSGGWVLAVGPLLKLVKMRASTQQLEHPGSKKKKNPNIHGSGYWIATLPS